MIKTIAFQGQPGAYSDMACRALFPQARGVACLSFDDVFRAVQEGRAERAMIPIENSTAGRVAEVHDLLFYHRLFIVGEHYQPVDHCLLALKGASMGQLCSVLSHIQALSQCRQAVARLKLEPIPTSDTAGAAAQIAKAGRLDQAAIASRLASNIHGLEVMETSLADQRNNVTRFCILASHAIEPDPDAGPAMTTVVFDTSNRPAALYHALGGFAEAGVNLTRLEGFLAEGGFRQARFTADIEGHCRHSDVLKALETLADHTEKTRLLGCYSASSYRLDNIDLSP